MQANTQRGPGDRPGPFVFLGGNLALDLVNTEIKVREKTTDLFVTREDAARWWEMAQQRYPHLIQIQKDGVWNEQEVAALRTLRQILRHIFEALATHQPLDEEHMNALNTFLKEGYYALEISSEGNVSARYKARDEARTPASLPVAFAACSLLMEQDLSRLHICQNERCVLLFYDHTKSATRHWCSTACMNRARSRKNYRLSKTHATSCTEA